MSPNYILFVCMIIQMMASMAVVTLPSIAPVVAQSLNLPTSLIGQYISILFFAAALSGATAGIAALKYGPIRISQISLVISAFGLVIATFGNLFAYFIAAVFIGLGYGMITPSSSVILANNMPPRFRTLSFSIKQTGVPLGTACAGLVLPPLAVYFGWQASMIFAAVACVIGVVLTQSARAAIDVGRNLGHRIRLTVVVDAVVFVVANPALRILALSSFVFSATQMCFATFIVSYLNTEQNYSLIVAGYALAVANISGALFRLLWGYMCDSWISTRAMLGWLSCGMAAASLATALMTPAWPIWCVMLVCLAFGATAIGWTGVYLAEIAHVAADNTGVATSGCMFFTFFGVVVVPSIFAVLLSWTGTSKSGFVAIAVLTAIVGVQLLRVGVNLLRVVFPRPL